MAIARHLDLDENPVTVALKNELLDFVAQRTGNFDTAIRPANYLDGAGYIDNVDLAIGRRINRFFYFPGDNGTG
jgi:hypothetical protein